MKDCAMMFLRRKMIKNRKEAGTVDFVNGVLFAVMASLAPFSPYDGLFFLETASKAAIVDSCKKMKKMMKIS